MPLETKSDAPVVVETIKRKKRKFEPSAKMVKYVVNKEVKGMNKKQSALAAGYSPSSATAVKRTIESKDTYLALKARISTYLAEYGVDDKKIALVLSQGMEADRADGKPDYPMRLAYTNRIIELQKEQKEQPNTLNLTQVNLGELSPEDRSLMLQRMLRS